MKKKNQFIFVQILFLFFTQIKKISSIFLVLSFEKRDYK